VSSERQEAGRQAGKEAGRQAGREGGRQAGGQFRQRVSSGPGRVSGECACAAPEARVAGGTDREVRPGGGKEAGRQAGRQGEREAGREAGREGGRGEVQRKGLVGRVSVCVGL
jgi:hypothetical protein